MKGSIFAAAAVVGSAMADSHLHRRHEAIHQRRDASSSVPALDAEETCGCTTKVITYYGSPTLVPIQTPTSTPTSTPTPESTSTLTSTIHSTSTTTQTVTVTPSAVAAASTTPSSSVSTITVTLPTNGVTSFSATGTYTIPATTMTVTDTTTVCGATTTAVPSGTHTIGEVTTVVESSTVVTCPYATTSATGTTVTDIIAYTTYTCPVAGTYTVVTGTETVVPSSTTLVYPTVSTITPGVYTKPETTITATVTDTTYYCPYATSTGLSSSSVAAVATSSSTPVAVETTSAAAETTTAAAATTSVVAATSTSSAAASTGTSSSGLTGSGQLGMTFSPYTSSGECMTKSEVTNNLKVINEKGFDLVRVYSTDCNSLEYIGSACKALGMKMILGVYIESTGTSGAQEQVEAIAEWAQWSMVELIVVGNEAVSSGYVTAAELASFITSSKSSFTSAGYTGQVTTTEPIDVWEEYGTSDLCSPVDIVGANIHPFFNSATTAAQAGAFALSEYKILEKLCSKDVLNLETGWPSAGNANGDAVPGVAEQETAIKAIAKAIGSKSIFFSYANDEWKSPGEFDVEQHWGCASVF
jgi:exo-beta-1,3-glucanase (GH17 family)